MADEKAAFGVFPQMAPRRSRQDREAAKNVPVDLARGLAAGALGQVGDVESLIRMLPGLSENTFFPTSEEILAKLPFGSNTPVSRAAAGLGTLGGGFYTGPGSSFKAAMGVPGAFKKAGQDFLATTAQGGSKIFIGPKHKSWDQLMADRAIALEKQGVEPAVIWRETGTYRAPDGKLRQEISDDKAVYNNPVALFDKAEAAKNKVEELRALLSESSNLKTGQKDLFPKELTAARKPVREEMSKTIDMRDELKRDAARFGHRSEYVLEHPELYEGIPELANVRVYQGKDSPYPGVLASADTKGRQVDIYKRGLMSDPDKSMIHELQHVVQDIEGFSPGASSLMARHHPAYQPILDKFRAEALIPAEYDEFLKVTKKADSPESLAAYEEYKLRVPQNAKNLDDQIKNHAAQEWYKRTVGETEARNAEKRMNMTPEERRAAFPGDTADVPFDQQIPLKEGGAVRMDKGGAMDRANRKDEMRATPVKSEAALGLSKAAQKLHNLLSEPFGYDNPPGRFASELIGLPAVAQTLERVGYGEPLTTGAGGLGGTTQFRPEVIDAALSASPLAKVPKAPSNQLGVIKMKGGNWLGGSNTAGVVENQLGRMKMSDQMTPEWYADRQRWMEEAKAKGDERAARALNQDIEAGRRNDAINNWIDRNLTNYVKKEMATPEDPVRKLAEQGILHMEPYGTREAGSLVMRKRAALGHPAQGLGQSEQAKFWERLSDSAIDSYPAGSYKHGSLDNSILEANPWLKNVPDETMIHSGKGLTRDLGFDHIVDVLRQDVREGRIRPEQLNKVSMEQAVRRTYEYDQEMAKKMREAQIKATEGMPVHKEYPEGYKWIELTTPKGLKLPEGYKVVPDPITNRKTGEVNQNSYRLVDPNGRIVGWGESEEAAISSGLGENSLKEALKYEGETMGHCVGGYCPDVLEGRSRIFSLRDAKGEPHVTVEANPRPVQEAIRNLPASERHELAQAVKDQHFGGVMPGIRDEDKYWSLVDQAYLEKYGQPSPRITQIKGKQNRAPKEEYLPYVQDFVRSGKWSDVGDIQNTGLRNVENWLNPDTAQEYRKFGLEVPKYATDAELEALHKQYESLAKPDGMASGGSVKMSSNPDVMRLELAGGGAVKEALSRLARALPKTKEEINAIAERMAPQMTGEFVRGSTGTKSVADKTQKQFQREKDLPVDIRATGSAKEPEKVGIGALKDKVLIGIAGDPTVTGKTLHSVGDVVLESPAPQHGGPLYGLGRDDSHFWASGLGAARRVQNLAREASQQYDAPSVGKYVMMGPDSINYAQHFADANLQAIDLSKMSKKQIEGFNSLLRKGSPASGPRPSFPGIEDKGSAYLQMSVDPELRKHFNSLMQMPTVTEKFGLPSGQDIRFAITEPELRNLETGVTGHSIGMMRPDIESSSLKLSEHPTYSHDIPGHFMGQSQYPVPYELMFPDTVKAIRENPKQAPHEFGSLKMVGPRQIVDQQLIDEIEAYNQRIKQLTGKKKGGAIKKAGGGEITAEDLEIEERPLR